MGRMKINEVQQKLLAEAEAAIARVQQQNTVILTTMLAQAGVTKAFNVRTEGDQLVWDDPPDTSQDPLADAPAGNGLGVVEGGAPDDQASAELEEGGGEKAPLEQEPQQERQQGPQQEPEGKAGGGPESTGHGAAALEAGGREVVHP